MTDGSHKDPNPLFDPLAVFAEGARKHAEIVDMSRASQRLELYRFLDDLSADQLRMLRFVLNQGEAGVNYIDGMVASIIRLRYNLDPDSGEALNPEALLKEDQL